MDEFYKWLGPEKCKKIELIVMDMWKAFRTSAKINCSQATILYDNRFQALPAEHLAMRVH